VLCLPFVSFLVGWLVAFHVLSTQLIFSIHFLLLAALQPSSQLLQVSVQLLFRTARQIKEYAAKGSKLFKSKKGKTFATFRAERHSSRSSMIDSGIALVFDVLRVK
jgi:hypothetical protein